MVGDWKSLLSNLGGTGPDPTLGGSAEADVLLVDGAVPEEEKLVLGSTEGEGELMVDGAMPEEGVLGSTEGKGDLEPGDMQEGSPLPECSSK